MKQAPTALIADDEPLLRDALSRQLALVWPELVIKAQARNGREALEMFEQHAVDICFLDIRMPGLSGVDVAQAINRRAHLVFVTAYDDYAVQAFSHGALDYLVKPVEPERLADTVARLQARLKADQPPLLDVAVQLQQLATQLAQVQQAPAAPKQHLKWINAQSGPMLRLIPVDAIDYFQSDTRYTRVAWHDDAGVASDAIVSMTLAQLVQGLDPALFSQVHRSVLVNLHAVSHLVRGDHDTARLHLRRRKESLPVSRRYLPQFRAF